MFEIASGRVAPSSSTDAQRPAVEVHPPKCLLGAKRRDSKVASALTLDPEKRRTRCLRANRPHMRRTAYSTVKPI